MRAHVVWLALLLCIAQPLARAETPREEAARHYELGAEAFKEQRYADAETEFQAAYTLAPEPALLYNLGRARAALGHHADAADTFDRYIATQPPGTERAKVEALAVEEHTLAAKAPPTVVIQTSAPPPPPPARHRFPYPASSSLGVIALALGATSLGTGIASQHQYTDLDNACPHGCDDPSAAHRGEDLKIASIVTLSIGSVAAVAGAIAFAVEHRAYRRETRR